MNGKFERDLKTTFLTVASFRKWLLDVAHDVKDLSLASKNKEQNIGKTNTLLRNACDGALNDRCRGYEAHTTRQ